VRGSLERDISSLRAFGPGGGQISRVVHVSTRADFGVFAEKYGFVQEGHTFIGKVWFRARGAHISRKSMASCRRGTHFLKKCGFVQEGHTFLGKVWCFAQKYYFLGTKSPCGHATAQKCYF